MTLAVGDILKVRYITTQGNQTAYNVRHYRVSAIGGASVTEGDVAQKLDATIAPLYRALMTNIASWWGTGAQKIRPLPVGAEVFGTLNQGLGTAGNTPNAKQVAGFFNLKTALAGRRHIGKLYVAFPDTSDDDGANPRPNVGYMTRLGALAAKFRTNQTISVGADSATLVNVVFHKLTATTDDVVTITAKQAWATQRRRGDFGRPNPPPF